MVMVEFLISRITMLRYKWKRIDFVPRHSETLTNMGNDNQCEYWEYDEKYRIEEYYNWLSNKIEQRWFELVEYWPTVNPVSSC